ncbi:MAG: primosomal protein N' [Epulopiscium sp. Nuni2H_MBin003]|nr:MAG: primosomal protein N' [Epulopiscium sp. Nuni2H_MBin003]
MFTYKIPKDLLEKCKIGTRVKVPFGFGNRNKTGYLIEISPKIEDVSYTIKNIIDIMDKEPIIDMEQIDLLKFLVEYYGASYASSINAILPPVSAKAIEDAKQQETYIVRTASSDQICEYLDSNESKKSKSKQLSILATIITHGEAPLSEIVRSIGKCDSSINTLIGKGFIKKIKKEVEQTKSKILYNKFMTLNTEQKLAYDKIMASDDLCILLEGVTGSGKTEVFLHAIRDVVDSGKGVIVLVPEIALTKQTQDRFIERFGNIVALTHSRLNAGERKQIYLKAKEGRVQIVIGPRSAVFMPVKNLELIIIDEEHDASYKSELPPKYNAIEVAIWRMSRNNGKVILASATPSIETYYKAKTNQIEYATLTQRAGGASMPNIEIVDMRDELAAGNNNVISSRLHGQIEATLKADKQVMLLLNRRGHSTFISCRKCGFVMKCHHCDMPFTYHQRQNQLICHYCMYQEEVPAICPNCQNKHIRFFGNGTQKVEEYLNRHFENFGIARMDFDTTSKKGSLNEILTAFKERKTNVLVGTQMISKGHDFSNVTLVGIIAADSSLYMEDFRANERTYQLLTQTLGRAGRGKNKGNVIIQTYSPDNPVLYQVKLSKHKEFYEQELDIRQVLGYPPFAHLFVVLMTADDEQLLIEKINMLYRYYEYYNKKKKFKIIGPVQASIPRIANRYRYKITIIGEDRELILLYGRYCIDKFSDKESTDFIKISWDVDPKSMI